LRDKLNEVEMLVKDLIEELQKLPEDRTIYLLTSYGVSEVEIVEESAMGDPQAQAEFDAGITVPEYFIVEGKIVR
jgi:hypothetical protein